MNSWIRCCGLKYFILSLAVVAASCTGRPSASRLSQVAYRQFGWRGTGQSTVPDSLIIAVDESGSMQGFAKTAGFQRLLQKTITTLGSKIAVSYYSFDTTCHKLHDKLQLFNPGLYTGYATNFKKAFALGNARSGTVLILITDFQFNNEREYLDLVQFFQAEISEGTYIKLFSSTPQFDGWIYPQFVSQARYKNSEPRPLYAIAVGKSDDAEFIEDVLRRVMPWDNSITLSDRSPSIWRILRTNENARVNGKTLALTSIGNVKLQLRVVAPIIPEWQGWNRDDIKIVGYSFQDSVFVHTDDQFAIKGVKTEGDTCFLDLSCQAVSRKFPQLWRIFFIPESVPRWVSVQSCEPGGNQATKTLKLKDFIEDVTHTVPNPFSAITINLFVNRD